ncbi:MAG TPA: 3-phosphoshikimate 1-carboxyvinyltransferase [Candidatus Dormibacteraeota bacterium]
MRRPARLEGVLELPGDKSVSHRALLLNSVAAGEARVENLSGGADVASTASCLRALGVEIEPGLVRGRGLDGLRPASGPLDCGNSGTTMRLLAGLLAGRPFASELVGDASLSRRPMGRVVEPLRAMGAAAEAGPPLRVGGSRAALHGIDYRMPVPSAQVKSAVLLAGLQAEGTTRVTEPVPTRDHTERMLEAMGAKILRNHSMVAVEAASDLRPLDIRVPADLSAAAFWLVAGTLHPGARITLRGVGVNPSRSAVLSVLERAGLQVQRSQERLEGLEPVADLEAGTTTTVRALSIDDSEAPLLIDELPVLAVAATQLPGVSRITGAGELRVKESDRIAAMATGLNAMGAAVRELEDGWEIHGPSHLEGAPVRSEDDHRVAMALAVAGLLAEGETTIEGADCVAISYPGFWDDLEHLCRA